MDPAQTLTAIPKSAVTSCGWCHVALGRGEAVARCTTCKQTHHGGCWTSHAGCSTGRCPSAPRLDVPAASAWPPVTAFPPGMMACPACQCTIPAGAPVCTMCNSATSPDGQYHGPRLTAPGAESALSYALLGLILCGVVLGPLAIAKANQAREAMRNDPTLTGEGLATAGTVIGIVDLLAWAALLIWRLTHL